MKIEIDLETYIELKLEATKLSMLEAGGVDNWDWYSDSIDWDSLEELEKEIREKYNTVTPQD